MIERWRKLNFPHFAHFPRKTTRDDPPRWNVRFPVNVRSCHLMGAPRNAACHVRRIATCLWGEKFRSKFNFSSENAIGFEKELLITWGNGTGRRGSDLKLIVGKWKFEADGEGWNMGSQPLLTCSSTTWRSNPNKARFDMCRELRREGRWSEFVECVTMMQERNFRSYWLLVTLPRVKMTSVATGHWPFKFSLKKYFQHSVNWRNLWRNPKEILRNTTPSTKVGDNQNCHETHVGWLKPSPTMIFYW